MSQINAKLTKILSNQFRLDQRSPHGPNHWMRVKRNGLELAEKTGANKLVVELFAIFHDSCRVNDNQDKGHGKRGAKLAKKLHKMGYVPCSQDELDILIKACEGHTGGITDPHCPTIATCWDADRLDLPRVGIDVDPNLLCTGQAKDPKFIELCRQRALDWQEKQLPEHHDDWELSTVRKAEPKNERVVIYIPGRGGNTDEGLGGWLKSTHPNRIGLSINQQFLSLDFEKQIQVIQDLVKRFDAKETLIIANSYGAYLLAQALLNIQHTDAQIILLSPVLARGKASNSMFMSRPPGESRIIQAMESGDAFENKRISVHIGSEDDADNICEISRQLGIENVNVIEAGHNLPIDYVQKLMKNYLET